jgi:hypothetical protein
MLSITTSTSLTEESDVAGAVLQHRPDNTAGGPVDNTHTNVLVEDPNARHDVAGPSATNQDGDVVAKAPPTPPDAEALATHLEYLLGAVLEVEQLSRQARETAGSDLVHYDALVTASQVLEHHLQRRPVSASGPSS